MWPDFNFRDLPLSLGARNQFAGIYEAVRANGVPQGRSKLLAMITEHAYAPDKGTYMPVSEHTYLQASCPASRKMWAARYSVPSHGGHRCHPPASQSRFLAYQPAPSAEQPSTFISPVNTATD